jgi:squalene cyclase
MEDYTMRVLGLKWAGMDTADVNGAAQQLRGLQREDGGWAQLPTLSSDAYATGKALYALRAAMGAKADQAVLNKGVRYLRETRHEDGSWKVVTRAYPLQPLVDNGFPYGRDQWASVSASSWAVMGLLAADADYVTQK